MYKIKNTRLISESRISIYTKYFIVPKITKYYGHGDLETIAKEILGFTKMNWNSFNLYTKLPATIDTSNTLAQVGNLLRQYNGVTYDYRFFI